MSYTHRYGWELRELDEKYTRDTGPMRRCTGLIRYQDGAEVGSRMLFLDPAEAWAAADRWRAALPERRTVSFYESWVGASHLHTLPLTTT